MTLQDLGAIGELVGGIAVVITLIYIAVQLRQNNRLLRFSMMDFVATSNDWEASKLIDDPNLAALLLKMNADQTLTESEALIAGTYLGRVLSHQGQAYLRAREVGHEIYADAAVKTAAWWFSRSAFARERWTEQIEGRAGLVEFRELVEQEMPRFAHRAEAE